MVSLGLIGCSSTPTKDEVSQMSNYDLCREIKSTGTLNAAGRVVVGLFTLGVSEITNNKNVEKLELYRVERDKRKLGFCDAKNIARADCRGIYTDHYSNAYKQCLLTTRHSIEARIASDDAKKAAKRAEYQAYQAEQAASQAEAAAESNDNSYHDGLFKY